MHLPRVAPGLIVFFRRSPRPCIPDGERIYAIGDVHGRYDLLTALINRISDEQPQLRPARTSLIMLGDLIDRGPESRRVLELVYHSTLNKPAAIVLRGNHEDALIASWHGDLDALDGWLDFGGIETLHSYGIDHAAIDRSRPEAIVALMRSAIPGDIVEWLEARPLSHRVGDYFFVHAGIRPGIPLADQEAEDLLWIRDDFLDYHGDHGVVVVHGHTISKDVEFRTNRIGIDTGSYRTNRLTALCLWGSKRRIISVHLEP